MSVETDITKAPTTAAPEQGGATPTTPVQDERPTIRVGNSGALMARSFEEIERQMAALATEGRSPSSSEDAEPTQDTQQVAGEVSNPAPVQPQGDDRLTQMEQRLAAYEKQETERKETERAAQLQYLNQQQQADYTQLSNDVENARLLAEYDAQQLQQLQAEQQQAYSEGDYETVNALNEAIGIAQYRNSTSTMAHNRLTQQHNQFTTYSASQYDQSQRRAQADQIAKIAQKYGLTPDDVRAVNPNLDVTKPFEVQDTMLAALHKKLSGETKLKDTELKNKEAEVRKQYREEFDNSPGAQPHPGGTTNTSSGNTGGIRMGNSGSLIKKAWGIK